MNNSTLASTAQGIAKNLTYNDGADQAQAKHILLQCAHRLDSSDIRAKRTADGLMLINARGKQRYATWRERLAYWIAGTLPREV